MMAPGTSSMLRARRRDVNVKPNRRLDRKSSRGMLYENEELRLRTININAEVERGQNDIKKLRRENEQLRREIWGLREEYDRLEGLLGKAKRHSGHGSQSDDEGEEEDEYDEEEDDDDEADLDNAENQQKASSSKSRRNSIRVLFDGLSVVDEETDEDATCESGGSRSKLDQQFFGKIKLPNGREGVYQSDTPCAWSQQQGIYNYSFTPVDTLPKVNALQENDGYFGTVPAGEVYQTRGGPDLFISGAYPLAPSPATFPAGGNLDQLLRQMNDKESECVPPVQSAEASAQKHDRQNVDALAVQLDEKLEDDVKGMRVANGNCFVCLKNDESAEKLLNCGLAVPGERVSLMDATQESVLVSATGVPPEVSDDSLVLSLSQCGSVIGGVQRKFYKGVDTGERLLRLKLQGTSFPRSVAVAGCTVTLQTVTPNEVKANGEGNLKEHNVNESKTCKTLDRFRSEISVRLRPPSGKGNRSLDNIYDFSSFPKQLHNTSLPIITAPVNQETSFRPLLPENHHRFEENGPFQSPLDSTKVFSPLLTRLDPQNAFANLQNQTHIVTDDSADSIDVFQHNPPNFHNNPFLGGFHVPVPVNPFASPQYTPSLDNQRNMFLSQPSGNVRVCSPYPHMNTHLPSTSIPSPHINPQHSPQVAGPAIFTQENTNHLPNLAIPVAVTNPGFFLAAQYLPSEISPQPSNMSVSTPVLNMLPPQINSNPSPTQVITNSQNATKEMNKSHEASEATSEVTKPQSLSVPSSPAVTRRPKPTFLTHQQSRSSGEEGASPSTARRKVSRKVSSNSTGSQQNVDTSVGPTATSSPNTKHKTSVSHSRKISGGASSGAEASGSSHTNVVDVSRSSSSGQDSPTKPDRRRRVSIYFNNKKGSSKRRDSVFVPNGGGGILAHSSSLDTAHRYGSRTDMTTGHSGAGETTTCSERERTNSASSRTSSRKHSECSNRGSLHDTGKVPWCGCWGNGCI